MKIKVNGINVNYEIQGDGPVVTFGHALGTNLSLWEEQARALEGRYRVLRFDTRGHGQSSAPAGAYTLEQLADDLKGLLDGLGIKETHYAGISMGGMIGQIFALRYPAMIQSLVLCDTTSRYPADAAPVWQERIRAVETTGMEGIIEAMLERWFTAPFRKRRPELMDRVRAMLWGTNPQGYVGCCHALPKINVTDRLKELRCPTLIVVGEEDPGTPVEMAREIHRAKPGSELVIIPSASHLSNIEQPGAFNAALLGFLERAAR